ncbi:MULTISPECIES: CesT family type III secretion system chaperone [Citrobacter]|uniref:Tir chaperone n=1 Tax=Citrobacter pasteurii TaxID=1563222 RepID=A0A6N6KAC3_9ENTR|nr:MULTISPECIES: CesT family type III secretion system chaperone [Citrobacter]KAA1279962.1 hypothetical protein DXF85_04050 [Citrobacter pasteurii]QXA44059.1 type III secretion system chaperone [Citrobacter pasteurii]TKU57737.1 type III secretion system chaperone [Citrobacter sp. wls715]
MKYINSINMLLSDLGKYIDCKDLTLNNNGSTFVFLSDMLFSFILSDEDENYQRELICIIHIAPLPKRNDEISRNLLIQLLQGNHAWSNTGGGILGFDDQTGFICLSLRLNPLQQTTEIFSAKIARLYQIASEYKSRLAVENSTAVTHY